MRLGIHHCCVAVLSLGMVSIVASTASAQDYQKQYQQAATSLGDRAPQLPPPNANSTFGSSSFGSTPTASTTDSSYEPQTPIGRMAKGLNPANWKMPSFKLPTLGGILPGKSEKDMIVKRKDSLVTEVKQSAQRSWTRTKDALNPMKLIPAGFRSSGESSGTGKPSTFLGSFMKPSEPEPASATQGVNDFLKNNRPLK